MRLKHYNKLKKIGIILIFVIAVCWSRAADVVLFSDSFNRSVAQQNDIDATSIGMSGLSAPIVYVERGDLVLASNDGLTNIENNQLHLADGSNMTTLYLEHNFIEPAILAAGGMRIGLTIISNDGAATDAGRWVGFGMGNTLTECQTAGFDHKSPGFRGQDYSGIQPGTSDIFVSWSPYNGGIINVYKNGPTAAGGQGYDIPIGGLSVNGNDRLELELLFKDFNAGSTVQATVFWNDQPVYTTTFQWDKTNQNYMGICSRQDLAGFTVDDLILKTTSNTLTPVISQFAASPSFIQTDDTAAQITLNWTAAFVEAGSAYAITADKAVTFPGGNNTGPAVDGQLSIQAIVNGALGDVEFTVTIYEGATAVVSSTTVVRVIPEQNPQTPNFIVILTDDQGWGTTSVQIDPDVPDSKSDFFETPNIERLAERGIRFTQAYSPHPNCSPSRASLLTGRSPAALHFTDIVDRNSGPFYTGNPMIPPAHINNLPAAELTIPELLKRHNSAYTAAHFGKWHLNGGGPAAHGFDVSDGNTGNNDGNGTPANDPKQVFGITRRGNDWMEAQVLQGKPFYLQLSHYATHTNILYRPETKAYFDSKTPGIRHRHAGFAAMLYDLDESIGRVLDKVNELGIQDNTYIIYMADNGSYPLDMPGNINGPIRGWKATAWEGGVRVPLIVVGAGITGGTISREPVVGYDILPTICEMAGIDRVDLPQGVEGGSFAHILQGDNDHVSRSVEGLVFHWPHYQHDKFSTPDSTLLLDGYKLHFRWETRKQQLYYLDQDLAETIDLARVDRDIANEMTQKLLLHLDAIGARRPTPNPDYVPVCWDPSDASYPPDDFMGRNPSPYDFNGDCEIEIADLDMLTAEWLKDTPLYDLDGNSKVDFGDFERMAEDWLGCWWLPVELNCL
jgi:arylsulfatase A-like enzyme